MEVQKRFAALSPDLELYLRFTPYVLSVEGVHLLSRLDLLDLLLIHPCLMSLHSFLIPGKFIFVASVRCRSDHVFDSSIDNVRLLQDPLADVFAAVRALLAMNQRLIDARFAERVAADCCAARDDVVHANWTVQLVY